MTDGSAEQPEDNGEEDSHTTAPEGSFWGPIDPNGKDDELPEGEPESESGEDWSEDEGDEPGSEAGEMASDDDLEYADYWNFIAIYSNLL